MKLLNFLLFCCGASLASFTVCTAFRYQNKISILTPRSFCDHCRRQLKWWQLVPILGWLLQKGRCAFCGHKIPLLSFVLELIYGSLFIFISYHSLTRQAFLLATCLQIWLLLLALEDHYTMHVSSRLLYFGSLLILLQALPQIYLSCTASWLQLLLFFLLCFTFEKMNKLGQADTFCLLVLMLIYGFELGCYILLVATTLFLLNFYRQGRHTPHAFLPCLTAGFVILTFLGLI